MPMVLAYASFRGDVATIRAFEAVSVVLYGLGLWWVLRQRNPVYLGAWVGATLVFGLDWFWSTNSFFQAVFSPHLVGIPGISISGQHEPLAVPMNYAFGFAIPAILYAQHEKKLAARFGRKRMLGLWAAGAIGVGIYEIPVVHILGIWTYHQKPGFLVMGFPWSNFWLAGNLIAGSCIGVALGRRWSAIPDGTALSLRDEVTWKGIAMGAVPVMTAFYLTGLIQLWWYSAAKPWTTPFVRPF
ncbi:MAG TPA: hypothetical protein VGR20_02045 [Acidimicrobiia bacterium]|nr:hypothetical protein [Acidimicrobiia bacterium]